MNTKNLISNNFSMGNLFVFHTVTLVPLFIIFYYWNFGSKSTVWFIIWMFIYAFVFRPITDFYRLKALGILEKKDFWKIYGLVRFKHYYELMFKV